IEVEEADGERHHPRIRPVRDVDIEIRQKRLDGPAEQSRVVAGHRRNDQELRLNGPVREVRADKAEQIAERPGPNDVFEDRIDDAVDLYFVESEDRLAVTARHPFEQLRAGRDVVADSGVGERIPGIAKYEMRRIRNRARRDQGGMGHLVELIRGAASKHRVAHPTEQRTNASPSMSAYRSHRNLSIRSKG